MESGTIHGETLAVPERVIVAPAPGTFRPVDPSAGVEAATARAKDAGIRRVIPLNVGAAFHTRLMAPAAEALTPVLAATAFSAPTAPVVSNADARLYADGDGWADRLAAHLVSPVRWRSSMETLAGLDIDTFFEVGPGNVLAALARRTVPAIGVRGISVPTDALLEVA